jgi:Protein of unknown function (DUF2783)
MLITDPNLRNPDAAYARLIAAHDGLTEAQSQALNARLVLILMNHAGDAASEQALKQAATGLR